MDIAETGLERGTCLRRNYGAIIVKNDAIISTGYVGAPRGRQNCIDMGVCIRENLKVPRGERYELCRSVHAEQNAIINAAREDMIGSTMFLVGKDAKTGAYVENACACSLCKRLIINAGISRLIIRNSKEKHTDIDVNEWVINDESIHGIMGY